MYSNRKFKTDLQKWDGHNAEELRSRIIRELYEYLRSGDCPQDCEPEYRETLRKLQTEFDFSKLRKLIQDYYFESFDSMQFWDADVEKSVGNDFPIYREVLGLYE